MLLNKKLDEVAQEYIKQLKNNQTSSDYVIESVYRVHIQDFFGKKRINAIKKKDIKELQNQMINKVYNGDCRYSNKTINMVTSTLNMIVNYAVNNEYIKNNPCMNFPKLKIVMTHEDSLFWTDEEFKGAIEYESDYMWYCYLIISYLTGMRKGEIRGLQWRDVNFSKSIITINRHINDKLSEEQRKEREKSRIIKGRKNGGSHIIMMDNSTMQLLKQLKHRTQEHSRWNINFYVFGNENPVGQNSPKRHLDAIADRAGLQRIKIHGLRHSHVSFLISKGLNAYEIAERIGDNVDMVLKVYGHLFPNPQKNIVKELNESFNFDFGRISQFNTKYYDYFENVV